MKNCEYYQLLLSNLIDEKLRPESNTELDLHLKECAACREFQAELSNQNELLSGLPEFPYENTRPRLKAQPWYKRELRLTLPVAAAAVILLALWSVINIIGSFNSDDLVPVQTGIVETETVTYSHIINFKPQQAVKVENSQTNEEES